MRTIVNHPTLLAILFAFTVTGVNSSVAQVQDHCDGTSIIDTFNPLHYKLRGQAVTNTDRCEGLYKPGAPQPGLHVASLVSHFEKFPHSEQHNLLIQWSVPDSAQVAIAARGISQKNRAYRMDTYRPVADSVFVWRRNVVSKYGLNREDIGLTGMASLKVDGQETTVYIPLRISERPYNEQPQAFTLTIEPNCDLEWLQVSILNVNLEGDAPGAVWLDRDIVVPQNQDKTPVEVVIPVAELAHQGMYRVQITAHTAGQGPLTEEILFYNPYDVEDVQMPE